MKAKDTGHTPYDNWCSRDSRLLSEVFTEGKKAGIGEVMELLQVTYRGGKYTRLRTDTQRWQAKLKELGIG